MSRRHPMRFKLRSITRLSVKSRGTSAITARRDVMPNYEMSDADREAFEDWLSVREAWAAALAFAVRKADGR